MKRMISALALVACALVTAYGYVIASNADAVFKIGLPKFLDFKQEEINKLDRALLMKLASSQNAEVKHVVDLANGSVRSYSFALSLMLFVSAVLAAIVVWLAFFSSNKSLHTDPKSDR
jgi:hypothetical protein